MHHILLEPKRLDAQQNFPKSGRNETYPVNTFQALQGLDSQENIHKNVAKKISRVVTFEMSENPHVRKKVYIKRIIWECCCRS